MMLSLDHPCCSTLLTEQSRTYRIVHTAYLTKPLRTSLSGETGLWTHTHTCAEVWNDYCHYYYTAYLALSSLTALNIAVSASPTLDGERCSKQSSDTCFVKCVRIAFDQIDKVAQTALVHAPLLLIISVLRLDALVQIIHPLPL